MNETLGKCYYCQKEVMSEENHAAFTKKWNKDKQKNDISDYFHMTCYIKEMHRMMDYSRKTYRQMTLFDFN